MNRFYAKKTTLAALLLTALLLGACSNTDTPGTETGTPAAQGQNAETIPTDPNAIAVDFSNYDLTDTYDAASATAVKLGSGTVTIDHAGTYILSGKLTNGQVIVNVPKTDKVHLVLDGVDISCPDSAAIWIQSCDKTRITLAPASENHLSDGTTYANPTDGPSACLYSKDDLVINGSGTLTVTGNYNNGIVSTNDLRITGGTINVKALKNGIKGNDTLAVRAGTITVNAGKDGLKTENLDEAGRGYIAISGGTVTITAADDAIQATQAVSIHAASVTTYADGDAVNCDGTTYIADGCLIRN